MAPRHSARIGHIDLLHSLFQAVSIPTEVARELSDPSNPALNTLDPGERSAIALGISLKADLILIDERKGSAVAAGKGLTTTGTIGILDLAAKRKLIDLRDAVERLGQTNFRYRKDIIERLLAQSEGC